MSDFNLNLMKVDSRFDYSQFYNTFVLIFVSAFVFQPTRVTGKSKALIGNVFFKSFEFTAIPGNITHSIYNQLIQFVILEYFTKFSSPCKSNTYINEISKILTAIN